MPCRAHLLFLFLGIVGTVGCGGNGDSPEGNGGGGNGVPGPHANAPDLSFIPDGYALAVMARPAQMIDSLAETPAEREQLLEMFFEASKMGPPPEFFPPLQDMERVVVAMHGEFADKALEAQAERERVRARWRERELHRGDFGKSEDKIDFDDLKKDEINEFAPEKGSFKEEKFEEGFDAGEKLLEPVELRPKSFDPPKLELPKLNEKSSLTPRPMRRPTRGELDNLIQPAVFMSGAPPKKAGNESLNKVLAAAEQLQEKAAMAAQSAANIKMIMLAMHNYHDTFRRFPPAFSKSEDGKPLLSWRVLLLPFLEEQDLYDRFHLDEPWNSEHNKALLSEMPEVFKSPVGMMENGKTRYLGLVDEKTVLTPNMNTSFASILDGASNTMVVVEAANGKAVDWTAPIDLDPGKADYPGDLLDDEADQFLFGFADGSAFRAGADLQKDDFLLFCHRDDGEFVDHDSVEYASSSPAIDEMPRFVGILESRNPINVEKLAGEMMGRNKPTVHELDGKKFYLDARGQGGMLAVDEKTVLMTSIDALPDVMASDANSNDPLKRELRTLDGTQDVVAAFVVPESVRGPAGGMTENLGPMLPQQFQDLLKLPSQLVSGSGQFSLTADPVLQLSLTLKDGDFATQLETVATAALDLGGNLLKQGEQRLPDASDARAAFSIVKEVHEGVSVATSGPRLTVKVSPPDDMLARSRKLMLLANERAKEAQKVNDLKQVGLAMHNHHDVYRQLPPIPKSRRPEERGRGFKPNLSWRVHILPFLEQQNLYEQFKFDEPWDSEHNLALLEYMPETYRTGADPTKTSLLMVVGRNTAYEGHEGLGLREFVDGLSNTIFVVRAGADKAVPWTKPVDLPFDPEDPVGALGQIDEDKILVLFADGSVRKLDKNIAAETFKAMLTRNGNETLGR